MSLTENAQTEKERILARSTGGRIAIYRKALRMDQRELARRLNVKPSTLNRWETGYTPVSVYELLRVAEVLKMPASWFLGETVLEESPARHLQQGYQRLSPGHQSVLLTLLQELLRLQEEASDAGRSDACAEIFSESQRVSGGQPTRPLEAEPRGAVS